MTEAELGATIVGITEMAKYVGMPAKYCPGFAIILAIGLSVYDQYTKGAGDYVSAVLRGIVVGTTTTGLYAAGTNVLEKATVKAKK